MLSFPSDLGSIPHALPSLWNRSQSLLSRYWAPCAARQSAVATCRLLHREPQDRKSKDPCSHSWHVNDCVVHGTRLIKFNPLQLLIVSLSVTSTQGARAAADAECLALPVMAEAEMHCTAIVRRSHDWQARFVRSECEADLMCAGPQETIFANPSSCSRSSHQRPCFR